MAVKKTYEIVIRVEKIGCELGPDILNQVESLPAGEYLRVRSIIGMTAGVGGRHPVYLEKEMPDHIYGKLASVKDADGNEADTDELRTLIKSGSYEVHLTHADTAGRIPLLTGDLLEIKEDATSVNTASDSATASKLQAEADRVVKEGFVTKEELDERLAYMRENQIDAFLQTRVLKGYRLYKKPVHRPSCLYRDPYLADRDKAGGEGIIADGLRQAVSRCACICEGEKSVGKNVYLETLAWLLGMPIYLITFSRQMSPSSIYGEKTTDNTAAEILKHFDSKVLRDAAIIREKHEASLLQNAANLLLFGILKAVKAPKERYRLADDYTDEEKEVLAREAEFKKLRADASSVHIVIDQSELYDWLCDGGLMVFNEQNMAEANFFASFTNQLLDGTGFLFIPGRGEVPINKDCVLFGTQNADYQGVEEQNDATVSRFGCLYFMQPDSIKAQLESAVAKRLADDGFTAKPDPGMIKQADAFYRQCRGAVQKNMVTNMCLNIRGFVAAIAVAMESDGHSSLLRQIEIHVIDICPTDERAALKNILRECVTM
jgi:hypothetical protein